MVKSLLQELVCGDGRSYRRIDVERRLEAISAKGDPLRRAASGASATAGQAHQDFRRWLWRGSDGLHWRSITPK
jgi:hypothetical protein